MRATIIASIAAVLPLIAAEAICGRKGYDRNSPVAYFYDTSRSVRSVPKCAAHCAADSKCEAYAFGSGACHHYSAPLSGNFHSNSGSAFRFYDKACDAVPPPSPGCGVKGYDKIHAYVASNNRADLTFAGCKALCVSDVGECVSFAIGQRSCLLYKNPVASNVNTDPTSEFSFYDVTCGNAPPSSSELPQQPSSSEAPQPSSSSIETPQSSSSTEPSVSSSSSSSEMPVSSSEVPASSTEVPVSSTEVPVSSTEPPVPSSVLPSSTPTPLPGNCSYTASCSSVVNGVLSSNSIASPQLVDYRLQTALLELTSPDDFLAALGADPCQRFTDPGERESCVGLVANSEFIRQLTDITISVLSGFQTCASNFARGVPDYPIIINNPNNGTCVGPSRLRRHVRRVGDDHDLTRSMLDGIKHYVETKPEPQGGPMKNPTMDLIQLSRRQSRNCALVGQCFERCPDCRDQQTTCGAASALISTDVCAAWTLAATVAFGTLAVGPCLPVAATCGPAAPYCEAACVSVAGGLAGAVANSVCARRNAGICVPITQRCANCNNQNNGICNENSAQCCAGETGTRCGVNCCCCPQGQAPGGMNCACTASA